MSNHVHLSYFRPADKVAAPAPTPTTNAEFTRALSKALHRPAIIPVPAFALRLVAGEMADALLLASTRVMPGKLLDSGFVFQHPTIDRALADIL